MSNPIWHFRTGKINGLERSRAQERRSAGPENKRNNNKSDGGSDRHQDKCRVIERHMAGCQVCPLLAFLSCSVFLFWWGEILSLFLFYAARQSPSRQKRRATGQTGLSLVVGVSIVRLCACAPCHHSTGWQRIHLQSPYLCMLHRYLYPSHAPSSVRQLPVARLSGIDMPANGRRRRYPFSYSSVRLVVVVLFFSLVR